MKAPQPEWRTIKELLPLHWPSRLYLWCNKAAGATGEIDAGKRLVNLERTWLPCLRVNMIPVEKTECDIAVLLDLKDNNVAAQSVNRSSGYEHAVP